MNKKLFVFTNLVFLWIAGICLAGEAPHQIGIFVLNQNISELKEYVIIETALPIRHMENIEEVEIKPMKGIKSGLIAYVTCSAPGKIARIKLKYKDPSKKFFEELLKQIKKKYGKPDEYRGDPFHIVISWKWSFVDKDNQRISMTLQHNAMDTEEKIGNSIKLTNRSLIEEDLKCYKVKALDQRQKLRHRDWQVMTPGLSGWDLYVPQ
jgi:CRISPR/Cas system endoribonuclease Cas6 (RAMP superfamily)